MILGCALGGLVAMHVGAVLAFGLSSMSPLIMMGSGRERPAAAMLDTNAVWNRGDQQPRSVTRLPPTRRGLSTHAPKGAAKHGLQTN